MPGTSDEGARTLGLGTAERLLMAAKAAGNSCRPVSSSHSTMPHA
jgi:hypothetical protein